MVAKPATATPFSALALAELGERAGLPAGDGRRGGHEVTAGGFQMLLDGAWTTIWISLLAIVIGMPFGFVFGLIRVSRFPVLSQIVVLYVSLGRATPLVTLTIFLFVTMPVFGINIDKYTAGVVALTLNTASFNTEIWRSVY